MEHVRPYLLILLSCLFMTSSLVAADQPLDFIPDGTSFVCRFESPQRLKSKFDKLTGRLQGKPQLIEAVDGGSDFELLELLVPSFERIRAALPGADEQQDWWAFGTDPAEETRFGLLIPATDPDALVKSLDFARAGASKEDRKDDDTPVATIIYGKWVIHGDTQTIDAVRECIAGKTRAIEVLKVAEARRVFDRGSIGLFLDIQRLASDAEMNWQRLIEQSVDGLGLNFNAQPGVKRLFASIPEQLGTAIDRAIQDSQGLVTSVTLDDEELRLETYVGVKTNSPTSEFFRANPASTMQPFAALPASCAVYCGFHRDQKAIGTFISECYRACGERSDPGFTDAHAEVRRGFEQLEYGSFVAAFPVWPVERGLLRMISITEVNDPQQARELGLRWMELPPLPGTGDARKLKKTLGVEKFAGHPVDVVTSPSSIVINPLPMQDEAFDKLLFGLDGHVTRTIYLKDRIVEATGGTKLEMAATVRQAESAGRVNPEDQPLFLKTRQKLGEKSNVLILVDLNGIVAGLLRAQSQLIGQMVIDEKPAADPAEDQQPDDVGKAVPAHPSPTRERPTNSEPDSIANPADARPGHPTASDQKIESQIESLKSTAGLLGLSLTLEPQAARLSLVVPMKSIQGLLSAVDDDVAAKTRQPDDQATMLDEEPSDSEAEAMPGEPEQPASPPEEKIIGDRIWKGKILERKTFKPIAGAEVTVKLSTTGDETTTETKTLRETVLKTGDDGTYEFTVKEDEASKSTLYLEFTIRSNDHVEFYGGYGYRLLLKNEKMGERPFFEDIRLARGRSIEGTVKTPEGNPAAGIKVIVCTSPNFQQRGAQVRFPETRTDANGHFRLVIFPQARAILWIMSQDYAIQTRPIRQNQEGDLGAFVLNPGPRISGKVVDAQRKPVAGIYVEADLDRPPPQEGKIPLVPEWVADQTHRATITAEDGSFEFRPLPPGKYQVFPSEKGWDPSTREGAVDPPRRPLPGVFLPTEVTFKRGEKPAAVEMRAIPHVVVEIQSMSSKGPKRGGPDLSLFGTHNGVDWQTDCDPSPEGLYRILAPKGLDDASVSWITNEHTAVRFRTKKGAAMSEGHSASLGKLTRDQTGMQIFSYQSPVLIITAKSEDGEVIKDLEPKVWYVERRGKNPVSRNHVGVQKQDDGKFRTVQAPPGREMEVTIEKAGFKPATQKITLPEGKTESIEIVLQKD